MDILPHPNQPDWLLARVRRNECLKYDGDTSKWCANDLFLSQVICCLAWLVQLVGCQTRAGTWKLMQQRSFIHPAGLSSADKNMSHFSCIMLVRQGLARVVVQLLTSIHAGLCSHLDQPDCHLQWQNCRVLGL